METEGDLGNNSGKRDEGTPLDLVVLGGHCNMQTSAAFSGGGLMRKPM